VQVDAVLLDPAAVGLGTGAEVLDLVVLDDPVAGRVHQHHLAGAQGAALHHAPGAKSSTPVSEARTMKPSL
jgi:hypothetical protein